MTVLQESARLEALAGLSTLHSLGTHVGGMRGRNHLVHVVHDFSSPSHTVATKEATPVGDGQLCILRPEFTPLYYHSETASFRGQHPLAGYRDSAVAFRASRYVLSFGSSERDFRDLDGGDAYAQLLVLHAKRRRGPETSGARVLRSAKTSGRGIAAARSTAGVLALTRRRLTWFDWALNTTHSTYLSPIVGNRATPIGVAAGADGTAYAVSEPSVTGTQLFRVDPNADEPTHLAFVSAPLDPGSPVDRQAWTPIPGPDGRVALAPEDHLMCFNADGSLAWNFPRKGMVGAVPVQGGLLVEHDAALFHLDWSGKFRRVWTGPAPLTARPLFHDGAWFVSTEVALHRLVPA